MNQLLLKYSIEILNTYRYVLTFKYEWMDQIKPILIHNCLTRGILTGFEST